MLRDLGLRFRHVSLVKIGPAILETTRNKQTAKYKKNAILKRVYFHF